MSEFKNFISTQRLKENLNKNNLVIVDCRGDLLNSEYGIKIYKEGHISDAVFVDLKKDLSSLEKEHGGRNPLPGIENFKVVVEKLGISNDTLVVAYDEQKIASASRFCWMLRYIGHKNNYILDGGINKWISDGYDLSIEEVSKSKGIFNIRLNEVIKIDVNGVREAIEKENSFIIDSRTKVRYLGEVEPIDKKAGHIPLAENYYWKESLKENGEIKDLTYLKERFKEAEGKQLVIVYCGSGIDATFNFMLLDEINISSKLYAGSWSDWITY